MVELLSPAGNKENLITAIKFGANAVYLGLKDFSARKSSDNFDLEELKWSVAYAKTFGVKVYVAVNTIIKDSELCSFISSIIDAYNVGVDAFILQDMFLGKVIKRYLPNVELHLSTQAGVCNEYGAKLALEYGFSRVILARETTFEDISKISKIIETEVFVQGALCSSFSGHCYFSSLVGGMSGNRGNCKQPCRKLYKILGNNNEEKGYSISLADLCLKDKLSTLINIGVKSFKIEGRLRSKEYVASATGYYRSIIDGKERLDLYKGLKTSFNRGDYTEGLAFLQKPNFISNKIQSNKGLKVGVVGKVLGDTIIFKDYYNYSLGDAFKIIREDKEVGNATVINQNGKLKIVYKGNVKVGDDINITKDISFNQKIESEKNPLKNIQVFVSILENEKIVARCNGVVVYSENIITKAINKPTTKQEIIDNFFKTDVYPYVPNITLEYSENLFVPKSVLNNVRAKLYYQLFYGKTLKNVDNIVKYEDFSIYKNDKINAIIEPKKAVITDTFYPFDDTVTDVIYMPKDYSSIENFSQTNKRVWLYLPPFLSGKDFLVIDKIISKFYGIYGQGYYLIEYAKQIKKPLFAGTGFNIYNSISENILSSEVECYALSKELSKNERELFSKNAFVLSQGSLELMELIYCPFSKNCKNCNKKDSYILQDGERSFPLIRYNISNCYFRVYNSEVLLNEKTNNELINLVSLSDDTKKIILKDIPIKEKKRLITNYTQGFYNKGAI